jgi:hypothetical protein
MPFSFVGIIRHALQYRKEIIKTEQIRPPRALFVPFPPGHPLREPKNPELQTRIMRAAFALLPRTDVPVLETFAP